MRIAPIQQQNHPNFYAKVKFSGDLEYVTKETKNYVKNAAKNIGKSTDTICFKFGKPNYIEGDSFSEQGHFYEVPPSISRRIKVHGKIKKQPFKFEEKYDSYTTALDATHEKLTNRAIYELLCKVKQITNQK